MNYQAGFKYVILKRKDEFLAIYWNYQLEHEIVHFYDQGYIFIGEAYASNAQSAIEVAKKNEDDIVFKLRKELDRTETENNRLRSEIEQLKSNSSWSRFNSMSGNRTTPNNLDPLSVLGFSEMPSLADLKKRWKQLSQKFHPDKDGSNLLMQIINDAYNTLVKTVK